eukprot:CAMPEP_0171457722 /NCGR_PEP_ID=MMETSP0945-20130129/3687_1 /TAXON_ID=109269 /ORGANISM="Vaucheria litorea, Strain CCMP2940" /LENGTH=247 /DNA_ID=CAMNT_0011983387 /DNA_START=235 /DNA_END=978 /DNA_ORIENTATION=-
MEFTTDSKLEDIVKALEQKGQSTKGTKRTLLNKLKSVSEGKNEESALNKTKRKKSGTTTSRKRSKKVKVEAFNGVSVEDMNKEEIIKAIDKLQNRPTTKKGLQEYLKRLIESKIEPKEPNPWNIIDEFQETGYTNGRNKKDGYEDQWGHVWFPPASPIHKEKIKFDFFKGKEGSPKIYGEEKMVSDKKSEVQMEQNRGGEEKLSSEVAGGGFNMAMFKPAEGSWKCDACFVRNDKDATKCIACETKR